jgi:uncharacterized protein
MTAVPRWLAVALAVFGTAALAAPSFPPLTGRVVDTAGILSPQAETEISAQLAAHEQATTNQVVVVTLKSLGGYDIADYGYQLGRHWGIGQKGKNNGVLLIVAPAERKLRIEVGYGLEGALTDATSRDIIERVIKPLFRQQHYDQGVRAGVTAILAALSGEYHPAPPPATARTRDDSAPVGAVLFGILAFLFMLTKALPRAARRGKGRWLTAGVVGTVVGVLFWILTSIVLIALILGIVAFLLALLLDGRSGRGGWGGGSDSSWGGGSWGGGGFSGGGGDFGGGGASGDW